MSISYGFCYVFWWFYVILEDDDVSTEFIVISILELGVWVIRPCAISYCFVFPIYRILWYHFIIENDTILHGFPFLSMVLPDIANWPQHHEIPRMSSFGVFLTECLPWNVIFLTVKNSPNTHSDPSFNNHLQFLWRLISFPWFTW